MNGQFTKGMVGAHTTHGMTGTRFWRIYWNMRDRCLNPKNIKYHLYGGKGIVCTWITFGGFHSDMYQSYLAHVEVYGESNTSIDRVDNDGDYCKDNCRWATCKEQSRNTTQNRRLTHLGKTQNISAWAEELNLHPGLISRRLKKGWDVASALSTVKWTRHAVRK